MHKLALYLFGISDKILKFAKNFEKIPNNFPEIISLILYPILLLSFGMFHEPWFDEAQAWQIAKCATYHDILFYIPHLEGHPPFWHLLLSIFAKNNFPYEITIKSISFIFSYAAVFFIVLKSPFYRIIRVVLPFTYFLFYQYAIISRPYCMVMLAFALLAIFYKNRSENPFKYAFSLMFLSAAHAYCLLFSAALAFVWLLENLKRKSCRNKNFIIISVLILFYLFIVILVFPSNEAIALNIDLKINLFKRLMYTFLMIPSNCFISNIYSELYNLDYSVYDIFLGCFVGLLVWYFICFFAKSNKTMLLTFIIPYSVFAITATRYIAMQHLGIAFCFIIFIGWIITTDRNQNRDQNKQNAISKNIERCFVLLVTFSIITNLYWNVKACVLDVIITYSSGRMEAQFIKKHNLDKYKIMTEWINVSDFGVNINVNGDWITIAPYFEKNIFYNFNDLYPEKNYVLHATADKNKVNTAFSRWRKLGLPDVILGKPDFEKVFPDIDTSDMYVTVYYNNTQYIHKDMLMVESIPIISVKKEIAEKLNLKKVEPKLENYKLDSAHISSWLFCRIIELKNKFLEKLK